MYEYVYVCMYAWVYAWVRVCMRCVYVYEYMFIWVHELCCVLQRLELVWWDPDPLKEIQTCARYEPDTLAIRRPTNGLIRRFVPVRVAKSRRRFGFKSATFYVSVYYYVISLFTVVSKHIYVTCIISCDRLIYFTIWLLVFLHEVSVSVHFNYVVDLSIYQRHFMCSYLPLWFKTSFEIP